MSWELSFSKTFILNPKVFNKISTYISWMTLCVGVIFCDIWNITLILVEAFKVNTKMLTENTSTDFTPMFPFYTP